MHNAYCSLFYLPLVKLACHPLSPYLSIFIFMCTSSSPVRYEAFLQKHCMVYRFASFSDHELHLLPSKIFLFVYVDHWRPSSQSCFWTSSVIGGTVVLSPLCPGGTFWWNPVQAQVWSDCCPVLWSTGVLSAFQIFQESLNPVPTAHSLLRAQQEHQSGK